MKKLQLKFGKQMLSKEQMEKIGGGYVDCPVMGVEFGDWFCCSPANYGNWIGNFSCEEAQAVCPYGAMPSSEYCGMV